MAIGAVIREKVTLTRVLWDRPWVKLWKKGMRKENEENGGWHDGIAMVEMASLAVF